MAKALSLKKVRRESIKTALQVAAERGSARVGRIDGWTVRIKSVRCGKPNCRKCPHKFYAYAEKRIRGKLRTRYLGVVR